MPFLNNVNQKVNFKTLQLDTSQSVIFSVIVAFVIRNRIFFQKTFEKL